MQRRKRSLLLEISHYWQLPRWKRERVRKRARTLEQREAEREAEDVLYERLSESAIEDVASELPYSLSAKRADIEACAAWHQSSPEYQENPARFRKVYTRAYRGACQLFRETRSIWQNGV